MTYNCGPYYVISVVLPIPLFVQKRCSNRHPGILVAVAITVCREREDYMYVSQQLKQKASLNTLVYGTAGEIAMEQGFEEVFPIGGRNLYMTVSKRNLRNLVT